MPDVAVVAHSRKSLRAGKSPFVQVTQGKKFKIRFDRKLPYELDGGARPAVKVMKIKVRPCSVVICVPARSTSASAVAAARERV